MTPLQALFQIIAELPPVEAGGDGLSLTKNVPVIRLTNELVMQAIEAGYSDLLLEPTPRATIVRGGSPGQLSEWLAIPPHLHRLLVNRFLVMAGVDMANLAHPQVGVLRLNYRGEHRYNCRLAWTPSQFGGKLHIRFYRAEPAPLTERGMHPAMPAALGEILEKKQGMVLFVGPPGVGKTTAVQLILWRLGTSERAIHTLEWPIEMRLFGALQTERSLRHGPTPDEAARAAVRSGADVFFLSALEDGETAQAAFFAVEAGLGVAATMSIADPKHVPAALTRWGIDRERQQEFVKAIILARHIPALCPHCRTSLPPSAPLREELDLLLKEDSPEYVYTRNPLGCEECAQTGQHGNRTLFGWWGLDATEHPLLRHSLLFEIAHGRVGAEELGYR